MSKKCSHYWVERFDIGPIQQRLFGCTFCSVIKVKEDNSPINYRDVEATKHWGKRLKEMQK